MICRLCNGERRCVAQFFSLELLTECPENVIKLFRACDKIASNSIIKAGVLLDIDFSEHFDFLDENSFDSSLSARGSGGYSMFSESDDESNAVKRGTHTQATSKTYFPFSYVRTCCDFKQPKSRTHRRARQLSHAAQRSRQRQRFYLRTRMTSASAPIRYSAARRRATR